MSEVKMYYPHYDCVGMTTNTLDALQGGGSFYSEHDYAALQRKYDATIEAHKETLDSVVEFAKVFCGSSWEELKNYLVQSGLYEYTDASHTAIRRK